MVIHTSPHADVLTAMDCVPYASKKYGTIRLALHIPKIQESDMQKKIGKLRLMGHDVDLIVTDRDEVLEKLTGELVLGACRCDQCKIWLDATLSVSQMQSTLYHEVNEFIRLNTGAHYSDDHDYFTAYHTIIWGEINNNKDWIFGNALKRALKP